MTHRRWDRSKSPERSLLSQGLPSGALPPAIRPGLHCGIACADVSVRDHIASPGHQAGAPLRRPQLVEPCDVGADFPRPSGRGSIAAPPVRSTATPGTYLPPAIRPGLPCGDVPFTTLTAGLADASPGHQAGAPLRHREWGNPVGCILGFPRPSGRGSIAAYAS